MYNIDASLWLRLLTEWFHILKNIGMSVKNSTPSLQSWNSNTIRTSSKFSKEEIAILLPEKDQNNEYKKPEIIDPLKVLTHLTKIELTEKEQFLWSTGREIHKNNAITKDNKSLLITNKFIILTDSKKNILGIAELIENYILKPKIVFNAIN